jgi:hypothetical protein
MDLIISKLYCQTLDSKNEIEPSSLTIDEMFTTALAPFHFDDNAVKTSVPEESLDAHH